MGSPAQERSAEENPTQPHNAYCLPESDWVQPEDAWHKPVPQVQDGLAKTDNHGKEDDYYQQKNLESSYDPFRFHIVRSSPFTKLLSFSYFFEFVVDCPKPLAQMEHGIVFAGQQCIHAHTGFQGEILEAPPFDFVSDEHIALVLG